MTARVAGVLYHTEKRNVLDWLRDKMTARTAGLLYFVNGAAGFFNRGKSNLRVKGIPK
jgi:hypothetical protein